MKRTVGWLVASVIFLLIAGAATAALLVVRNNDLRHIQKQIQITQQQIQAEVTTHAVDDQTIRRSFCPYLATESMSADKTLAAAADTMAHTFGCPTH